MAENPGTRNRRQASRREMQPHVNVQCRKDALGFGPNLTTMIVNLSATGICLIVTRALAPDSEVEILINGDGLVRPISRKGTVRWQVQIAPEHFGTGIEFEYRIGYRELSALTKRKLKTLATFQ